MDNKEDKDKKEIKFNSDDLKKPHYYGSMEGVHVFHGSHEDHKAHIGKHLENPSDEDLQAGLKTAKEKGLNMLYIHGSPPTSLRSKIHPELGAHVPGELGKSEEQSKRQAQYWFKLKHSPAAIPSNRKNSYVKYEMHASDIKAHAADYSNHAHHVLSHVVENKAEAQPSGLHGTAISRIDKDSKDAAVREKMKGREIYTPSTPIADHVLNGAGEGKKILYHGCGRDFGGALALAGPGAQLHKEPLMIDGKHATDDSKNYLYHNHKIVGGTNEVHLYDPFHYDNSLKSLPKGKFDEVHSHYTMNVIDHETGGNVMNEISSKLKPNGKAVVTARRDGGMKMNEEWKNINQMGKTPKKEAVVPKTGMKPTPIKKSEDQPKKPYTLADLHNAIRDEAKKSGHKLPDHIFKEPKPKQPKIKSTQSANKITKHEDLKNFAKDILKQIEEETVILTTKELAKGLISPEKNCQDCGCTVENCMCFDGFTEPNFTFDGKKLNILFKSDWDEASKESYLDDFKRRAGKLLNK